MLLGLPGIVQRGMESRERADKRGNEEKERGERRKEAVGGGPDIVSETLCQEST